ncbi:HipA domain-containing protein [Xanthomonas hortorum]|uniref:HipA domain-containing protein n=1 Tax=Xanthomonas hortorum TaxID=56454 RepID=UPI002935428E|nr:HipA domain-containing protein [Xanthomonas hortorum]MDV2450582.1 HipA domain-containing protein [Xanthomonas hortorum NBC5720]
MAELCVWMNGLRVALWREDMQGARLTYLSEWLHSPQARPLSLSLPLLPEGQSHRGDVVTHYFDNLLPDSSDIRRRMRERFKTDSASTFDLLQAVGRDCVGAIQLLAIDAEPEHLRSIQNRALTDNEVADVLRGVTAPLLPGQHGDNDNFRLSLAGAQEKTALLHHQHQWCVPMGSTPSTHIFKLPLGLVGNMRADMQASVENEWLCAQLLAAFGIPVAVTTMGRFQEQRALIVERFDRRLSPDGQWWMRLPQEDLCQAFGVSSSKKYESDGGPGIVAIMELLRQSSQPSDREIFFKTQILFWLIAATDGHAKNFSLMIEPGGRFRMTPLYERFICLSHPWARRTAAGSTSRGTGDGRGWQKSASSLERYSPPPLERHCACLWGTCWCRTLDRRIIGTAGKRIGFCCKHASSRVPDVPGRYRLQRHETSGQASA